MSARKHPVQRTFISLTCLVRCLWSFGTFKSFFEKKIFLVSNRSWWFNAWVENVWRRLGRHLVPQFKKILNRKYRDWLYKFAKKITVFLQIVLKFIVEFRKKRERRMKKKWKNEMNKQFLEGERNNHVGIRLRAEQHTRSLDLRNRNEPRNFMIQ